MMSTRIRKLTRAALACLITVVVSSNIFAADRFVLSEQGSERATTGAGNKIVTYGDKTHVVWQEATRTGYFNKIRTFNHQAGQWSESVALNQGVDNHARPVITIDHDGYLHVAMSGHNSTVTYRRSVQPNDSSKWGPVESAGSGTYPSIACGLDNTIYLSVRATNQKGADLYIRPQGGEWAKHARLIKRGDQYSGYAGFSTGLTVGADGVLHAVCNVYEGKRGSHQALCYLMSRDKGLSWETASGTTIALPARPEQTDLILDDSSKRLSVVTWPWINTRGNVVTDSRGSVYVAFVSHIRQPGAVMLAKTDADGVWSTSKISISERKFPSLRPIGTSITLSMTEDDVLHVLLELTPLDDGWIEGKPLRTSVFREEPVKRLVLLSSRNRGETFQLRSIIEPGQMFNMANMERPTGVNRLTKGLSPPIVYFDGTCRYPKKNEVINNKVYFVRSR